MPEAMLLVEILVFRIDNYIVQWECYNTRQNNFNNPRGWRNEYKELA